MKKIDFGPRPTTMKPVRNPDDWVLARGRPAEPTKRLTIDIPASLHRRVKTACAIEGLIIADVVRQFLESRFSSADATSPPASTAADEG